MTTEQVFRPVAVNSGNPHDTARDRYPQGRHRLLGDRIYTPNAPGGIEIQTLLRSHADLPRYLLPGLEAHPPGRSVRSATTLTRADGSPREDQLTVAWMRPGRRPPSWGVHRDARNRAGNGLLIALNAASVKTRSVKHLRNF